MRQAHLDDLRRVHLVLITVRALRVPVRARYREGALDIRFVLEVAVLDARELRDTERGRELRRGRRLRRRLVLAFGWHPAKKASPWGL